MNQRRDSTEDLIVRARRGELSETENRYLHGLLATSREAQLLLQAGIGFDAESPMLPGDDRFVELLADRVAHGNPVKQHRPWRTALLVALCSFLATSAAAGAWVALERVFGSAAPGPTTMPAAAPSAPSAQAAVTAPRAGPTPRPTAAEQRESEAPAAPPSVARPTRREAATHLFESANRARPEGHTAEAMALYEELQQQYPGAPEARHASLTLGQLHLNRGDASAALACFRRYRGRAMAAEALWGEARALGQLQRTAEERRALRTLAETFPASPYAEAARKRLESLDR